MFCMFYEPVNRFSPVSEKVLTHHVVVQTCEQNLGRKQINPDDILFGVEETNIRIGIPVHRLSFCIKPAASNYVALRGRAHKFGGSCF